TRSKEMSTTASSAASTPRNSEGDDMRVFRFAVLVWTVVAAAPAMAASNRVFVSSTGMDVGGCPISAPCRSFSYAMTQVFPGGEVIALDTAGYGTFTIGQSVSVFAAPGATA